MSKLLRNRYVLLERDGVINRRVRCGSVKVWEQFEFLPRALDGLRLLAENGCTTLIVSNQNGVGEGLVSSNELDVLTRRFLLELALSGGIIQQVYYCLHAPSDRCNCRKPRSGLLQRAQTEHRFSFADAFLIDDALSGVRAAQDVGCPAILIRREAFLHDRREQEESPDLACDLYEAAERILSVWVPKSRYVSVAAL